MATKKCPRCRVNVHPRIDKSVSRWEWSKRKPSSYVCLACEAELLAKTHKVPGEKAHTVYTESNLRVIHTQQPPLKVKIKSIRRKKKLCIQCNEVWFLIGVTVYPDQQQPLVCSKPCRRKYRKEHEAA